MGRTLPLLLWTVLHDLEDDLHARLLTDKAGKLLLTRTNNFHASGDKPVFGGPESRASDRKTHRFVLTLNLCSQARNFTSILLLHNNSLQLWESICSNFWTWRGYGWWPASRTQKEEYQLVRSRRGARSAHADRPLKCKMKSHRICLHTVNMDILSGGRDGTGQE